MRAALSRLFSRTGRKKADLSQAGTSGAASPGDVAYRSRLLAMWRAGDRAGVLRELDAQAPARHWMLVREGVDFVCAQERDPAATARPQDVRLRHVVLETVVDFGGAEAARAYAGQFPLPERRFSGILALQSCAVSAPPTADHRTADLYDDPARDLQVAPRAGSRDLVVVCCGSAHRFGAPLTLLHQWFRQLDASIVYLRDFERMYYLGGLRSCGSRSGTVEALRRVASELGARRLHFAGHSSGGFAALLLGLEMQAHSVLSLAGVTRVIEGWPDVEEWAAETGGRIAAEVTFDHRDHSERYRAAASHPRVRLVYGERYANDVEEAETMAGIAGVELVPLPGIAEHGIISILAREGTLSEHLKWLTAGLDHRA